MLTLTENSNKKHGIHIQIEELKRFILVLEPKQRD